MLCLRNAVHPGAQIRENRVIESHWEVWTEHNDGDLLVASTVLP
jgi:hypothetical protein